MKRLPQPRRTPQVQWITHRGAAHQEKKKKKENANNNLLISDCNLGGAAPTKALLCWHMSTRRRAGEEQRARTSRKMPAQAGGGRRQEAGGVNAQQNHHWVASRSLSIQCEYDQSGRGTAPLYTTSARPSGTRMYLYSTTQNISRLRRAQGHQRPASSPSPPAHQNL